MNVFPRSRSLDGFAHVADAIPMLLFFLPTLLSAQTVAVPASGIVGLITAVPPIYNGPYVLQMTDYGFFWLDTAALRPGHVQVVSKCVSGFRPPTAGIYVLADCNTITNVSASGITSLVRLTSGQCGAQTWVAAGPGTMARRFTFGSRDLGVPRRPGAEIPDSTQTTDPQGRTWSIRPVDPTRRNFIWHVVAAAFLRPDPHPHADAGAVPAGDRRARPGFDRHLRRQRAATEELLRRQVTARTPRQQAPPPVRLGLHLPSGPFHRVVARDSGSTCKTPHALR